MSARISVGTRVSYASPGGRHLGYGTVALNSVLDSQGREQVLLCTDIRVKKTTAIRTSHETLTGTGHSLLVHFRHVIPLIRSAGTERYHEVPNHIGVTPIKPFVHDHIHFDQHSVGRIVTGGSASEGAGQISVNWFRIAPTESDSLGLSQMLPKVDEGGTHWNHCWNVPLRKLAWCYFNRGDPGSRIYSKWSTRPATTHEPKFAKGDHLVYAGEETTDRRGWLYASDIDLGKKSPLTPGVILKCVDSGEGQRITAEVMGGMPLGCIGQKIRVYESTLSKFEETFFSRGSRVEVVAKVEFRSQGKNHPGLQGQTATVVLSTDSDGDVGVEFREDIGAGSLDGAGQQGKCLFIPAKALKAVVW